MTMTGNEVDAFDHDYEDDRPFDDEPPAEVVDDYEPARSARTGRPLPYQPRDAKRPQDRRRSAAEDEGQGVRMASVEYRGCVFTFPRDTDDWPVEATLAFESSLTTRGLRGLIKPEEFSEYLKTKPTNRHTRELVLRIQKAAGIEGN